MGATPRKKTQALQDNPQKNTSFFQYNKPKKLSLSEKAMISVEALADDSIS